MNNDMTMSYELITPNKARALLETVRDNRKISKGTVKAYTQDMRAGNWDETVGAAISIDSNGVLVDGQHRCAAIAQAGIPISMWVCRNVSSDGIYDNNRKRSNSDQIAILQPDFNNVYKGTRYISVARAIICHNAGDGRRTVTPKEVIDFTLKHKRDLDGYFLRVPQVSVPKISISVVHLSLFLAYMCGINIEKIIQFYDILCSGMSTSPEEFPIIAYRNYLKDATIKASDNSEIARCQYALKKYLTGSCIKRSIAPKELIYGFPYKEDTYD